MINNLEIEYKVLLSKEDFERLSSFYPNKTFIRQVNTYYDTEHNQIKSQGCALRIREKEGKFMITLKTPAQQGHHEYECYIPKNDVSVFMNSEIASILNDLIDEPLEVKGECITDRALVKLDKAELCFDINTYRGTTDYEVEYEQTEDHYGISEFNEILSLIGKKFTKNCPSKVKRALNAK